MVFTIVTVVFLPLSFLAAFFAIVLEGLPYNAEDRLPLSFILKYVVGVGLSTALAFVFLAWHHHSAVRWLKRTPKWFMNAVRWIRYTATVCWYGIIVQWRTQRDTSKTRRGDAGPRRNPHGSGHSKVSPASSSTTRERRSHLNDDLEKGQK